MDTPGHVDFAYEVSRSLAACEGSLLVVDASQGVEAQTLANVYQAIEAGHEIVPVLNKIDLPAAEPDRVKEQIEEVIGLDASDAIEISAKTGLNIDGVLEALVSRLPPPKGDAAAPLKALLVDSWYDSYLGVVILVRVKDGVLKPGQKIRLMATGRRSRGRAGRRLHAQGLAGRTNSIRARSASSPPASRRSPIARSATPSPRSAARRLTPCPASSRCSRWCSAACSRPIPPITSICATAWASCASTMRASNTSPRPRPRWVSASAAGFSDCCIWKSSRSGLKREFNLDLIATAPSVVYHVHLTDGSMVALHNPVDMPDPVKVEHFEEPWIKATILVPDDYLGSVLALCEERRGVQKDLTYVGRRAMAVYRLPLNEVVFDFYDRLKSVSRGYASFDYQIDGYEPGDLVQMNILVNGDPVDALAIIVHRTQADRRGRALCERLKELIPRQLFQIAIQAAVGGRVIARETIKALRKDVLAKCYGGDVSRKRKLLEKQKEGSKRMRQFGKVEIPQSAFIAALKMGDE